VEVYIPITVASALGSGSVELPAYAGNPITIQPMYTQDNAGGKIVLTWEKQTIFQGTTYIKARIKAVGTEVNLKKLDFNGGIGGDYLGFHIGTFSYPKENGGTTRSEFKVRLTPGIPDRRFAIQTNGVYEHRFIYVAVRDPQGSYYTWLNNNLGADYTNLDSPVFDPGQQATIHGDHHAFGSLFQFGRPADGHELVNYTNASAWAYKHGTTNVPATSYPNVGHGQTIIPDASTDALGADNTPYWFGMDKPAGFPVTFGDTDDAVCPSGFIVARYDYLKQVIDRTKANEDMKEFAVRLPTNAFVNRDRFHFGNYPYAPKLWGGNDFYSYNSYGTPTPTRTNSTDYYYGWYAATTTDYKFQSNTWFSPTSDLQGRYSNSVVMSTLSTDTNIPALRANGIYQTWGMYLYGRNPYNDRAYHNPSSSFPIRCRKQ
jgi:hypothetical protein